MWKALPAEVRKNELINQRAFNKAKEEECFEIATQAGDGEAFEYAKNMCWLERYQKRIPELKNAGLGMSSA